MGAGFSHRPSTHASPAGQSVSALQGFSCARQSRNACVGSKPQAPSGPKWPHRVSFRHANQSCHRQVVKTGSAAQTSPEQPLCTHSVSSGTHSP